MACHRASRTPCRAAECAGCGLMVVPVLALVFLLLVARGPTVSSATPLSVFQSVHALWGKVALEAAEETIKAIRKSAKIDLSLQDVPMDSFQVFVGRQHQLAVEVDGVSYDLVLGNEAEMVERAKALPSAASKEPSGGLVAHDWWQKQEQGDAALALPETTLTGPFELVLAEAGTVNLFTPHAADVGVVHRIFVDAGVAVHVSGLKRVSLRRPLELPRLPGQYLAEVYAHVKLGEPEEGFQFAPGILYMASQLRERGRNTSLDQRQMPVLSLEVEPVAAGSLTVRTAPQLLSDGPAPRLKVKKLRGGTVELTLRQGQVSAADPAGFNPAALSAVWAWPLPHLGMAAWVPYESVLRSILASHPFSAESVMQHGVGLRLTKSSIQGVNLVAFDMEVRGKVPRPPELEGLPFEHNETPLEIWEAVVQVQAKPGGGYAFAPLHVKRKASYGNTLTLSKSSVLLALNGDSNSTALLYGYDQEDHGLARSGGGGGDDL